MGQILWVPVHIFTRFISHKIGWFYILRHWNRCSIISIIKLHTLSKTLIKSMWKASGSLSIAKDNSKKFPLSSSRITKSKSSLVIDLNDCFSWLLWLWLQLQSMSIMVSSSVQVSKSKKYILKSSPQTLLTFVSKSRHCISFKNNLLPPKNCFYDGLVCHSPVGMNMYILLLRF